MSQAPQNFENHAMIVPGYHYVITGMVFPVLVWSGYRTVTAFSVDQLAMLVLVLALLVTAFYARVFPLGVQESEKPRKLVRTREEVTGNSVHPISPAAGVVIR